MSDRELFSSKEMFPTREEWPRRFKARLMERTSLSAGDADSYIRIESPLNDAYGIGDIPEDAADHEITLWREES